MKEVYEDLHADIVTEVPCEENSSQIEQKCANSEGSGVNRGDKDVVDESNTHCLVAMLPICSKKSVSLAL